MNTLGFPILSLLLWLPALGALILLALPADRHPLQRTIALGTSLLTLIVAVVMAFFFYSSTAVATSPDVASQLQFVENLPWISAWGASYLLGVDGISLWLVVLTSVITPFALLATWNQQTERLRGMLVLLLIFESALLGTFLAQDMLLFYVFWEIALLPIVFLVGMWGGAGRVQAALKLFLYTFSGSVLMLLGIIALYILHRSAMIAANPEFVGSFSLPQILSDLRSGAFVIPIGLQRILFGLFFAAFAVKLALWPFHTWLPDAYATGPTPGVVLLAAVMSKFGTYGLIRFNLALFPEAAHWAAPAIAILAVIGILYAAMVAFAQVDMQRMVAYASISHMNFIALGIFALNSIGISGALVQMISHGVNTAALILLVGVLYERRGTRDINAFGGLWKVTPVYAGLMLLVILATIGLPGLNAFVGEFTIMQGTFSSTVLGWPFALGAAIGVILAATYLLRLFRVSFMGEARPGEQIADLNGRELLTFGLLAVLIVGVGIFPNLLFNPVQGSIVSLVQYFLTIAQSVTNLPI